MAENETVLDGFISELIEYVKDNGATLQYNENIFEIVEGDLLSQLTLSLKDQLSGDAAGIAVKRSAPINVLNKLVNKTSTLYVEPPVRTTEIVKNQELINHYEGAGVNVAWQDANEAFNAYKWTAIELFEDDKLEELRFRVVPSHLFLPYSDSKVDPLRVTTIIKKMGTTKIMENNKEVEKDKFWIYTDESFIPITEDGDVVEEDVLRNPDDSPTLDNDFGIIPFTYISKSRYLLIPIIDSDTLQMTLLIPVLLTDMNFGSMFLSMPILYAIDVDAQDMKLSPNHFWNLTSKTDEDGNSKPQIGVVKAEPDLEGQLNNVVQQLSLWLYMRDVKPGAIGTLNAENLASGIAKIISEMDTVDNRTKQETYFKMAERDFWKRVGIMHNELIDAGRIDRSLGKFVDPKKMRVDVKYSDVQVYQPRLDLITEQKAERDAGFTSTKRAIRKLNPDQAEEFEDELLLEIAEDQTVIMDEEPNEVIEG